MSYSSISPIDRMLSGATSPSQSGPGTNGNEGILHIPKSSKAKASPSDAFLSFPGHLLGVGFFTPLQRCSRCILQSQPTGLFFVLVQVVHL